MSDIIDTINNRRAYLANGMDSYTVDGVKYTGYSDYTFIWEKSFVKSPSRAQDGAMGNLETYATFVTPHMIATYSLMSIDDYRSIQKQLLEKNEFTVQCYDPVYNTKTTNKMYFATPSTPTFYSLPRENGTGVDLIGVSNYTVELIGTNNK